ncbi:hypothetical protein Tco_1361594 [Tanacetum coccineum]
MKSGIKILISKGTTGYFEILSKVLSAITIQGRVTFSKECRSGRNQGKGSNDENGRRNATSNEPSAQALVAQDGLGGYNWSNDFNEPVYVMHRKWEESSKGLDKLLNSQMSAKDKNGLGYGTQLDEISNKSKTDSEIGMSVFEVRSSDEETTPANDRFSKADGYHTVPPPITWNFLNPNELTNHLQGNPEIYLQDHAVVDSGCSSHITGNKAYLSNYEDYNRGFVDFGSDPKGDELKFNLFSVSQMCDKKNSVLFTDTECLILSPSFKLLDESQVVSHPVNSRPSDKYSVPGTIWWCDQIGTSEPKFIGNQDPYVTTIARWRSRVTARPSSSHEFPIAPVTAPPGFVDGQRLLSDPGRLFLLVDFTAPILTGRVPSWILRQCNSLGWMRQIGLIRDLRLEMYSTPDCVLPSRELKDVSEAFRRWCVPPYLSWYPPTTSGSSSGDSLERPYAFIFTFLLDHLASLEEDVEVGLTGIVVDMELGIGDGDEVRDHVEIDHRDTRDDTEEYEADASTGDTAEVGIDPLTAPLVEEEIVEPLGRDSSRTHLALGMGFVRLSGELRNAQRRLEADLLISYVETELGLAEMIFA